MPRQKQPGAPAPKRRSRKGCWPCKGRKVKCGEEHPACKNCLKTGDVCDYSVRLNWEGRRAKRYLVDESDCSSPVPSNQPIRWLHEFSGGNAQAVCQEDQDDAEPHGENQTQKSFPLAMTSDSMMAPNHAPGQSSSAGLTLVFVDESPNLLSVAGPADGYSAKRRLAASQCPTSVSTPSRGSQLNSPTFDPMRHIKTESLAELTELDIGQSRQMPCPRYTQATTSSAAWPSYSSAFDGPLTPTPSTSSHSDDIQNRSKWTEFQPVGSPDSWSSGNGDSGNSPTLSGRVCEEHGTYGGRAHLSDYDVYPCGDGALYGYDLGTTDGDLLKIEDTHAVALLSWAALDSTQGGVDFGEGIMARQKGEGMGGLNQSYYRKAVPVVVPWAFDPLPDILKRHKMNLLYFHHFLDHTCQVLVPYHDADTNPLRTRLAEMARESEPLMSLILAYSAAHRSQLLKSNLPRMRMAEWAQSVFPALRESLTDDSSPVSNVTLAMAVMLVALEIMSPGAFGQGVSWREHLAHARSLVSKRVMNQAPDEMAAEGCWFIQSWLGYADVMGGLLAGPRVDQSCTLQTYFTLPGPSPSTCADDSDEIDCMMGVSAKCARLLGQVADLAKQCQGERFRLDGQLLRDWSPQPLMVEKALPLEQQLMESLRHSSRACTHVRGGNIHMRDLTEMAAINEAFHWAGLIHLDRRVLGKSTDHPDIQRHVQKIMQCLELIRVGGAAEMRCLFPVFTAGCEATTDGIRARLVGRLCSAEESGMKQIHSARLLLEQVWATGNNWEELICDEFVA